MVENNKDTVATTPLNPVVQAKSVKSYPYIVENKVIVHRVNKKSPLPTKDVGYNPADDYIYKIGSSFKAGTTKPLGLYVLTNEEQKNLMPQLIGISPTSPDYNKVLETYWNNISILVPASGLKLDCSIEHLSETESQPVNVEHYVIWKYCLKYSGVANTEDDIGKSNKINFVLWNEKEQMKKDLNIQRIKDEATVARIQMRDNKEKANAILYLFNKPVETDANVNMLVLAKLAEEEPVKFVGLSKDNDLLSKAFVQRAINNGILTQPPGSTLIGYEGNIIANNINDAVLFFKDSRNEVAKMTIEAKLQHIENGK